MCPKMSRGAYSGPRSSERSVGTPLCLSYNVNENHTQVLARL